MTTHDVSVVVTLPTREPGQLVQRLATVAGVPGVVTEAEVAELVEAAFEAGFRNRLPITWRTLRNFAEHRGLAVFLFKEAHP